MGLISIVPQTGGVPEDAGLRELIGGNAVQMSVASGVVTITTDIADTAKDTYAITYTSTAGNPPTDQELFDLWAPVVGSANGAAGPAIQGPITYDDTDVQIYPAITVS